MKLLWLTWKDRTNPLAGGAEVVNEELAKRLVKEGHEVTFLVGGFPGAPAKQTHKDGYKIIRVGGRMSVYWHAYRYYKQHLRGWADLVIDEVNTIPFFARWYVSEPSIVMCHQFAREIWFYEMPLPLSWVGYLAEPLYMRLLSGQRAVTVSESTKADLVRCGFKPANISIISEGLETPPLTTLPPLSRKAKNPTLLCFGTMRSMKRTIDQIAAFNIAKEKLPDLKLVVAGDNTGRYGAKVMQYIAASPFHKDIKYIYRPPHTEKLKLMEQAHLFMASSVREGWCLVVTENASRGTPAVVYDVPGLRDSVRDGKTGRVVTPRPRAMAAAIVETLTDQKTYRRMREAGWEWSKQITFEQSYKDFKKALGIK